MMVSGVAYLSGSNGLAENNLDSTDLDQKGKLITDTASHVKDYTETRYHAKYNYSLYYTCINEHTVKVRFL